VRHSRLVADMLKWVWTNTENITRWIQVVALAAAAYWGYTRFLAGEKPSLETRVGVSATLRGEKPGPAPDLCYVFLDVGLTNQGIASFDVPSIHLLAWHSEIPIPTTAVVRSIDLEEVARGPKIIDIDQPLNMHFSPGERTSQTYSWVIRTKPGIYLFRAAMDARSGKGDTKHISAQSWSQNLCTD
jgi:hypothetical protein